jgi:C-terminal processing protease CtpA/Prc
MKRTILAFTFLALVGTAPVLLAQDVERDQQRREEAERQLQEAQAQLEQAIQRLREAQTKEAQYQMEQAIAALRAAQRELRTDFRYRVTTRPGRGGVSVYSFGDETPQIAVFGGRPRIGVLVQMDRDEETDRLGAMLTAVTPGGPAEEAGLEAGDIITEANGASLASGGRRYESPGERFIEIVRELEEGDDLSVTYQRDGESRAATLSPRVMDSDDAFAFAFGDSLLGEWEPRFRFRPEIMVEPRIERLLVEPSEMIARIEMPHRWLNVELVTLDEDLGAYFGTTEGLLVVRAPGDADLNLRSGDVILQIDGRVPTSPSHALRILRSYEGGETVSMQIMRNKSRTTVEFTVPENDRKFDFER